MCATAVPYRQVTIPAESTTDPSGWVTMNFGRLAGFPASRDQQLMVMFVRAASRATRRWPESRRAA